MEADLTRLPLGESGWRALVDHALTLGDLAEVDYLELKGALPFERRPAKKRSAYTIGRAILGMANRPTHVAARHLGGNGVVLVGVGAEGVDPVERVDPAVLFDAINPYVGQDGLVWDVVYVDHADGLVMAVVVAPPSPGMPLFTWQKEYSDDGDTLRDGDILVRVLGKTQRATSQDIRALQQRLTASTDTAADISIEVVGGYDHIDHQSVVDLIRGDVDEIADAKRATARPPAQETSTNDQLVGSFGRLLASPAARKTYEETVEAWRTDAVSRVADVATELIRHERAQSTLRVTSSHYLEAARLHLTFPAGVTVLARTDTEYCHHGDSFDVMSLLPDPPPDWTRFGGMHDDLALSLLRARPVAAGLALPTEYDIALEVSGSVLTWDVGDLRPGGAEASTEELAIVTTEHITELVVPWRLTAKGLNHVFTGTLVVDCSHDPGHVLRWGRRSA